MSLKQSIVVRNEFSTRQSGGKGTRGSSPAAYIDYMTRDPAVEGVTPIKLRNLDKIADRYQAKSEAVDAGPDLPRIRYKMKAVQQRAGVAFCNDNPSMSQEDLTKKKREMEKAFQSGNKTWMKTVLSFSPEYLEEMGVVPPGFKCDRKGGYRGHIDQMKLRMAIMNGLEKMGKSYDDLQYVGTIQVDTWHVHCHLSMMDMGKGQIAQDGRQRGKISEASKQRLRRGIDNYLDETHMTRQMTSNVQHDKRNTVCFIKKFTHQTMDERGLPQFLLACLPEDKRLWRAGTNRKEMQKPNYIVRGYVNEILQKPESGYREALAAIDRYARRRQEREGLSDDEYRQLYRQGQQGIVDDCINGVYSVLKRVPNVKKPVRTPMMVAMAQSYEDMAADVNSDPMVEFGFRLRSYATRLDHHKQEKNKYKTMVQQAESQKIDETARPFVDFLKFEQEYNAMLMAKYQHFLSFLPGDGSFEDEFLDLVKERKRILRIDQMMNDPSLKRMKPDNAEVYGRKTYDLRGGRFVSSNPELLQQRRQELEQAWQGRVDDFKDRLTDHGMQLDVNQDGSLKVHQGLAYDFEDVKALDMHHLTYDFPTDVPVSRVNVERFANMADRRYELYQSACDYLIRSGQEQGIALLPSRDVENMKQLADRMRVDPVIVKTTPVSGSRKSGRTVRLDVDFQKDIDVAIKLAVDSQIEMLR